MTTRPVTLRPLLRGKRGFTLMETLVVMGIVVIVAGLSFPAFLAVKRSAMGTRTVKNMQTLQVATLLYQADNNGQATGTVEEMGLPPYFGFTRPFAGTQEYQQPWLKDLKSPFGTPDHHDYMTFALPSQYDELPIPWARCTQAIGGRCVLLLDLYEPGRDAVSGWWVSTVPHLTKRLRGVTLDGNMITRKATGEPYSQAWWYPTEFLRGSL